MLSGGLLRLDRLLVTISARAWEYFDRVVGPALVSTCSGLSMVALIIFGAPMSTLGDSTVLGDCCKVPTRPPTLGSGIGSRKVTVFFVLLFVNGSDVSLLLRISLIFCNTTISSFPRRLLCCRMPESGSEIANGLDYLVLSSNHWLGYIPMSEEYCVRDPFAACLFAENFMATIMFCQCAKIPAA